MVLLFYITTNFMFPYKIIINITIIIHCFSCNIAVPNISYSRAEKSSADAYGSSWLLNKNGAFRHFSIRKCTSYQ